MVIFGVDSWILIFNGRRTLPGGMVICDYKEKYHSIGYNIMPWVQLITFPIVPMIIIFVCNILIAVKVRRAHTFRSNSTQGNHNSNNNNEGYQVKNKLVIMLFAISGFFFLTTIPLLVCFIWQNIWLSSGKQIDVTFMMSGLTIARWHTLNNVCNFFLYTISGSLFRDELLLMIKCKRNVSLQHSNSTSFSTV